MQVTTSLNDLFSYSLVPILLMLVFITIILFMLFLKISKKEQSISTDIVPITKDINKIKTKYLNEINNLLNNIQNNNISNRKAYQKLSLIIRYFIYEMTSIKVQVCTLEDIKKLNIPILYELVNEYYNPEFAKLSKGNIINSIEKTKGVIEKWK